MSRLTTDLDRVATLTAGIAELDQARDLLVGERNELLRTLRDNGLTLRELAKGAGVSFQRVAQLLA